MQSNIFLKVAPLLKGKKYNYLSVLDFLEKYYNSSDWIYPVAISKKTKVSIRDVYEILEECVGCDIIKRYFNIYCPHCCRFTNETYDNYIAIPNEIFCPQCDNEITKCFEKTVVIYRVNDYGTE